MTIQYAHDVRDASIWSNIKILLRWKGSVWKDIYKEFIIWVFLFVVIKLLVTFAFNEEQKLTFDKISYVMMKYESFIPLTFMLGFYVTQVFMRWVLIIDNLAFIDSFSIYCTQYISGMDIRSRFIRRSILRFMATSQVLVYRDISPKVRKRFPEFDSIKKEGYLTDYEHETLVNNARNTLAPWWIPVSWSMKLIIDASKEGKLDNNHFGVQDCFAKIMAFKGSLQQLLVFDWFPIPLAYTQIVSIAVRSFFFFCIISRQKGMSNEYYDKKNKSLDIYVPVFTVLQFIFYMGWLKLAEKLVNPFGNDDDDLDVDFVLNRNLNAGLGIVDKDLEYKPQIVPDIFYMRLYPQLSDISP
uniref:Bestrophin homolog n=1 Tax=Strongyloides venezuelensis TaxID=75913 RepID=A0A0K0FYH8_STRVS